MALSKPFSSIVKVLVVCCFTIPLSEQKIVRDFVKGVSYGNFAETDNERLNTNILQSLSVRNLTECEGKCLINGNCFSGNYRKNKNQHGEHDCELLADNKFTSAQLMAVENSSKHFSVAVSTILFQGSKIQKRYHHLELFSLLFGVFYFAGERKLAPKTELSIYAVTLWEKAEFLNNSVENYHRWQQMARLYSFHL